MIPPDKKNDSSDCKTLAEGQRPAKPCLDGFVKCLQHKKNIETLALSSFGLDKVQLPLLLQNEGQALVYILGRHLCPSCQVNGLPSTIIELLELLRWLLRWDSLWRHQTFKKQKRRAFSATECPCIHLCTGAANVTFETQWIFFS